jgi:hypothetical protein
LLNFSNPVLPKKGFKKLKKFFKKNKINQEELLETKKSDVVDYKEVGFKNSQKLNLIMQS